MLNKYKGQREKMLAETVWPVFFTNLDGQSASLDDLIWVIRKPNQKPINLIFCDVGIAQAAGVEKIMLSNWQPEWALTSVQRQIIALYAAHLAKSVKRASSLRMAFNMARKLVSDCADISATQQRHLDSCFDGRYNVHSDRYIVQFYRWLIEEKLCPKLKVPSSQKTRNRYDRQYLNRQKKPDEENLIALGAIAYQAIPPDKTQWVFEPNASLRDATICALGTLGISTPTRIVGEFITLPIQHVQPETDADGKTVHRLSLQGSKGFSANYTHVLEGMADRVQQVLEYIVRATEPGRILARFYQNQQTPLKHLMPKPSKDQLSRINQLGLDLEQPIHLFQLGLAIGFYPLDHTVSVLKGPKENIGRGKSYREVALAGLSGDDKVAFTAVHGSKELLGVYLLKRYITDICGREVKTVTLNELQTAWVAYIKRRNPTWPSLCVASNATDFTMSVFALTGRQLAPDNKGNNAGRSTSYPGAGSFYALVSGDTLRNAFSDDLHHSRHIRSTIFHRHGFSSSFHLKPHQFSHYLNDQGEKQGLPHRILNLWSGRESPEHLLHYVHTTELERTAEIAEIMFKDVLADEDAETPSQHSQASLRVTSMEEYQQLRSQSKHIASTTSVGFCTQDLNLMPCSYMNDLVSQCTFCKRACHVAHDEEAIAFLKDDLKFQYLDMELRRESPNFAVSEGMKQGYKNHKRNSLVLAQLIELMEDPTLKPGTVIRVLLDDLEFRIADLKLKRISRKTFALCDADAELDAVLLELKATAETVDKPSDDDFLITMLAGL